MDKLSLNCACGQEMVVPRTALGRSGLCPGCGGQVQITEDNTRPYQPRRRDPARRAVAVRRTAPAEPPAAREDAWRSFAAAVDLYNTRRYAEALAMLDTLMRQFPGNPHVETARDQCLDALQRVTMSAYSYGGQPVDDGVLSGDLIRSVVLDKLLHGATEDVQLKAAELGARLLGLLDLTEHSGPESAEPASIALDAPGPVQTPQQPEAPPGPPRDSVTVHWKTHARRFTASMPATSLPPTPIPTPAPPGPHGRVSPASAPGNGHAESNGCTGVELVLPETWRLNRPGTTRFPDKTVFD